MEVTPVHPWFAKIGPNDKVKLRGRLVRRYVAESRNGGPVNFNALFGGGTLLHIMPQMLLCLDLHFTVVQIHPCVEEPTAWSAEQGTVPGQRAIRILSKVERMARVQGL